MPARHGPTNGANHPELVSRRRRSDNLSKPSIQRRAIEKKERCSGRAVAAALSRSAKNVCPCSGPRAVRTRHLRGSVAIMAARQSRVSRDVVGALLTVVACQLVVRGTRRSYRQASRGGACRPDERNEMDRQNGGRAALFPRWPRVYHGASSSSYDAWRVSTSVRPRCTRGSAAVFATRRATAPALCPNSGSGKNGERGFSRGGSGARASSVDESTCTRPSDRPWRPMASRWLLPRGTNLAADSSEAPHPCRGRPLGRRQRQV